MEKWMGAAGICLNGKRELLMVLEGRIEEEEKWSVPTGGLAANKTFEECVIREVEEETGYKVRVVEALRRKSGVYEDFNIAYEVQYFSVEIVGGRLQIQDPDKLIQAIDWKPQEELVDLGLNYPEDREYLIEYMNRASSR
jgi:8-oxo-dGTP diphosphatase